MTKHKSSIRRHGGGFMDSMHEKPKSKTQIGREQAIKEGPAALARYNQTHGGKSRTKHRKQKSKRKSYKKRSKKPSKRKSRHL